MRLENSPAIRKCSGFTLVELIVVMVLLAILGVAILPRLSGGAAFRDVGFHAEVVAALRYAQKSAVSHRRLVCGQLTASALALQIASTNPAAACGTALLRSPDGADVFASSSSASMSLSSGTLPSTLFFQPDGRITSDLAGSAVWVDTIQIADMPRIVVSGGTGYVK